MAKKNSKKDLMENAIIQLRKCTEFPRVGAVIAKDGVILSTGFRGEIKGMHAERVAIEKLSPEHLQHSTLYTTLEPCICVQHDQTVESCADLIVKSGILKTVIGVLDHPNGTIYSQGYKKLIENNIKVEFFTEKLRKTIDEETFEVGEVDKIIGPGKRRIPVIHSGTKIDIQFSENDTRRCQIHWNTLQPDHGCVYLSSTKESVRVASGATEFAHISDPLVFRFPSHFARMKKGMIAVVYPTSATFCLLVKLLDLYENAILFQWEFRNLNK